MKIYRQNVFLNRIVDRVYQVNHHPNPVNQILVLGDLSDNLTRLLDWGLLLRKIPNYFQPNLKKSAWFLRLGWNLAENLERLKTSHINGFNGWTQVTKNADSALIWGSVFLNPKTDPTDPTTNPTTGPYRQSTPTGPHHHRPHHGPHHAKRAPHGVSR
jgi:hypothetical protein